MIHNLTKTLFLEMTFHRMMTRTIFSKFIFRKSNHKVSWKCKGALTWYFMQFWTICLILNQKHLSRYANFSEGCRVVCSFTQSNSQTKMIRSSHRRCSVRKGVLRNYAKVTGKHLCQSLYFNKFSRVSIFIKLQASVLQLY